MKDWPVLFPHLDILLPQWRLEVHSSPYHSDIMTFKSIFGTSYTLAVLNDQGISVGFIASFSPMKTAPNEVLDTELGKWALLPMLKSIFGTSSEVIMPNPSIPAQY